MANISPYSEQFFKNIKIPLKIDKICFFWINDGTDKQLIINQVRQSSSKGVWQGRATVGKRIQTCRNPIQIIRRRLHRMIQRLARSYPITSDLHGDTQNKKRGKSPRNIW